jgi:hypothetical protein
MHCRANQLPDAEKRVEIQKRIEAVLAPHADAIDFFDLLAPQDEADVYLTVYWRNTQRAATVIPIHDETAPDFEAEIAGLLAP